VGNGGITIGALAMPEQDWVKRINYLGGSIEGSENLIEICWDDLKQNSKKITGLEDFGNNKYCEIFTNVAKTTKNMTVLQRIVFKKTILNGLINRLKVTGKITNHPAILSTPIDSPIIITGLPRTGTSILFEILSQSNQHRAVLGFEACHPVQSTITSPKSETFKRFAECDFELMCDACSELKSMHEFRHNLPTDCSSIMKSVLSSPSNRDSYAWHKKILQILQKPNSPQRWILKCVSHLHSLDEVLKTYKDAKIIHMHRDPVKAIVSGISIDCEASTFLPPIDMTSHAFDYMSYEEEGLRKSIKQRLDGTIPKNQITDIYFDQLINDPVGTIEAALSFLGIEVEGDFSDIILQYLQNKPRNNFGGNSYNAKSFGLSDDLIRSKFSFYTSQYGIEKSKL